MTLWTKCSDRMPPDTNDEFIFRFLDNHKPSHWCSGVHVNFTGSVEGYYMYEWAPYTLELWEELNGKQS